jgi:hypothetical protein
MIIPIDHLPPWLAGVASLLPATQLAEALRIGLGTAGDPLGPLAALAAWAAALVALATAAFRWE